MTTTLTADQLALATRILTGDVAPSTVDTRALDVDALISQARAGLGIKPVEKPLTVEAAEPATVAALVAWADQLAEDEKRAKEQREQIKSLLKAMVEQAEDASGEPVEQLTVAGRKVFSYSRTESRVLDQAAVKRMFPDIPEHAELYKTTVTRRATF